MVWVALLAGFVGVAIGVVAAILVTRRALSAASIAAERTHWREQVRDVASAVIDPQHADFGHNWAALAMMTNPRDRDDVRLVAVAQMIERTGATDTAMIEEFVERVALMLKHDWDRSTIGASWWPWRSAGRHGMRRTRSIYSA